jgi:hypothetical protein
VLFNLSNAARIFLLFILFYFILLLDSKEVKKCDVLAMDMWVINKQPRKKSNTHNNFSKNSEHQ